MTKKAEPDLKKLFKQAAEIAMQVPESMQDAAFNRALEMLTAHAPEQTGVRQATKRIPADPPKSKNDSSNAVDQQISAEGLIDAIDSTQHPEITSDVKILDRCLLILQIAHKDYDVDGLSPSEIAKILTDKFRISSSATTVSMALGRATNLVNRVSRGKGFEYRIMAPGLKHLAQRDDGGAVSPSHKLHPRKRAKAQTKKKPSSKKKAPTKKGVDSTKGKSQSSKKNATKSSRRPGPGAMLTELVSAGFFSEAKSISDIQEHAEHSLAHTYGINELSTPLRRAIHNKRLVRTKNSDGQYEYTSN